MTLQTSEGSKTAVCFSPEKRTTLEKHQADKSPVKISNIKFSSNYGKENVVVDQSSKISTIDDVGFQYTQMAPPSVISLLALNQVSSEQLVTLKGKVAKVTGLKKITTSRNPNSQLMKQELVIVDPTASVKVILWEQFVDCLKEGQTYVFKNLRLKRENNGSMYLNTPKSNELSFEECQEFAETVVADVQLVSSVEVCASITGVESISTYQACLKCGKKAVAAHGKLLECESCHMLQKTAPANKRWFLRCLFSNLRNEAETISLAIFDEMWKPW